MGVWGAGLTQSDEYCEVYDSFMEKYDAGETVEAITVAILNNYLSEFDDNDGILHDVYLALAKCQWMCGELSDALMNTVKDIIQSGKNLAFLKELDADERFLRDRKKHLDKFLLSLETPRKTPKKRKAPPKERPLPPANIGDVFSYKGDNGLRIMVVLDSWDETKWCKGYFCCILDKEYQVQPDTNELLAEKIGQIGMYDANAFLPVSKIRLMGNLRIPSNKYEELFGNSLLIGSREDFYTSKCPKQTMTLEELLKAKDISIFSFLL